MPASWKGRKRVVVGGLLLAVGATALLIFWPSGRSGRMLDGSAVLLEAVTIGKEHHSPVSKVAPLIEKLPSRVLRALEWHSALAEKFTVRHDDVALWLRFRSRDGDKSVRYAIADDGGFEAFGTFDGRYGGYRRAG